MTQWADAGLEPNEAAIQDHLLMGLLQDGAPIPSDHIQRLAQCGIHFDGNWFGLISLQVVAVDAYAYIQGLGHTSYSEAQLAVNILELLREELGSREGTYVFKAKSEVLCLLCGTDPDAVSDRLVQTANELINLQNRIAGIRLFAAVSQVREGFSGLRTSKQAVRQLLEYRVLHLSTRPVLQEEILGTPTVFPAQRPDIEKEQEILTLFKSGSFRQASEVFGSLFDQEYLALADPLILLKHKCAQYLQALFSACQDMVDEDLSPLLRALAPEQALLEAVTFPEVRAQMEHIFGHLNDWVLAGRKSSSAAWIMDVKNYIRGNYNDPDLNVNRVADEFGKNPSYLSRSFLRLTGTSILDYIHFYRIQEAKILIGRGETLAAAAAAVGYTNVLTMSRAFKKYEGTTPGKFKS